MYIMLNFSRYYAGLIRLLPASLLPLRGSKDKASIVLSAANLGQLARQLVAIDALSYVQSQ